MGKSDVGRIPAAANRFKNLTSAFDSTVGLMKGQRVHLKN